MSDILLQLATDVVTLDLFSLDVHAPPMRYDFKTHTTAVSAEFQ